MTDGIVGRLVEQRRAAAHWQRPDDPEWSGRWPLLWELLTTPLEYQGELVEPAALRVQGGNGEVVVSVTVGYLAQSTSAVGSTVADAQDRLEALLASGQARWSIWKGKRPPLARQEAPDGNGKESRPGSSKRKKK